MDLFKKFLKQEDPNIKILEERIVELEENIKKLQDQLEKNKKNVKDLTSKRQDSEEKLNIANIKIKTLEFELEKVKEEIIPSITFTFKEPIPFHLIEDYLYKIQSIKSNKESLLTVYVPKKSSIISICELKEIMDLLDDKSRYLLNDFNSNTGFVFFYDMEQMIWELFIPPIPIITTVYHIDTSFKVDIIFDMLKSYFKLCIIILKRGDSFVGIVSKDENSKAFVYNESFDSYKIIKSNVKSKHTKGGFSQRRFERLREEDIMHHVQKVQDISCDFLKNESDIDYIITGGDTQLMEHMLKDMAINIPLIESTIEVRIEKRNINEILKDALSGMRYKK